ncbi:MAG TPA: methylenetetrahydrofolate reductase C-terminal domain-containing protein [Sedimentisphaerales bacterium]|nr:methylenetetrahydrofolate reductase C-terminal domain-containing protein [Sedimentisphaerales bacterium]
MQKQKLADKLQNKSGFIVVAELTGGPNFSFAPVEKFLRAYKTQGPAWPTDAFDFAAVTAPQNPSGAANIEPRELLARITRQELLGGLDFVPHITCKDHNADMIVSSLMGLRSAGVESVLALTGDKPAKAKGVFELESVQLLQLIDYINHEFFIKASPDKLEDVYPFFPGAAVSPFKYTEASVMQQYYKMEKKITAGAKFFITQVGWDWKKSLELFQYLPENALDVPIIGNVYLLSSLTPAPRLMHDIKLTGCFVSDALLEKVCSETVDQHLERAAQQVAMYKAIGAAGVDIGGLMDFEMLARILGRAAEIGNEWQQFRDNLYWPAENGFYLYDQAGRRRPQPQYHKKFGQRVFNFMHRCLLDPDYRGFHIFKKVMAWLGTAKGKGLFYKLFNACEKPVKYLMFDCQACGDCFLPEDFSWCTMGGCEKGMSNAPCGDAAVDGRCGNNLDRICIGEYIYEAAAAEKGGLQKLRTTINKPRNPALADTSSILNYLFGRDHTGKNPVICIGETIHASIPKTGKIMKKLLELGPAGYSNPSGPLNYIRALIESQAADGADYIAVNIDAFGEDDPQIAVDMMVNYVELVRKWGKGVPVCVDSGNDDVLIAGLKQWYSAGKKVRQPLLNSVKAYTMDKLLPLKADYDYAFIALLISEQAAAGPGGSHSVDQLYSLAETIFGAAVGRYGFKPSEIFFDSTVFPLAIDMPMEPNVPGYTYRAVETIKKIKASPKMKGAHCSLGVSNSVRELPGRRIGVCRAYLAKAIEYGLDAAIVNVAHRYGTVEPDAELMELVDAYAQMDGSNEAMNKAMSLMGKFCQSNRKPPR